ncbi:DNA-methyltransferase [Heyndrickxia faecalis]|uniref:DNA-methyltransferase n=1 Tax=Heyndrickxia faecalis TaxID=2824910 RepID=UPI0032B17A00
MQTNVIINGNCIEEMRKLPNESIDLIITDPPYLIDYQSNHRQKETRFDPIENDRGNFSMITDFLDEAERIMKPNTAIYMFCSWHNVDFFKQEFEQRFKLKNILIWKKNNHGSGDLKGSYAPKYEMILFGHKGRALLRGKRYADILEFDRVSGAKMVHPTEKPVGLIEFLIKNSSEEGDIVLDGFAGSGSTLLAARNTNRKFIGYELDKKHFQVAVDRLNK